MNIYEEALALQPTLVNWRRALHRHAEGGYDLPQTLDLIRAVLTEHGVPFAPRSARRLRADDAAAWDYIVGMDEANVRNIGRMLGPGALERTFKLLTFAGRTDDVADPWYTGDFETTYRDVLEGCTALLERIESEV